VRKSLTSRGMSDPRLIVALCVASDIDCREAVRLRRLRES
jgi:hypothetical protein